MNHLRKLERILEVAMTEDLSDYEKVVSRLNKKLPFLVGSKRVAAVLLREYLGNISNLDLSTIDVVSGKNEKSGSPLFEEVKDGKVRFFINIGKNHNVGTGDLIREIVKKSSVDGKSIGKIDVHTTYSFFEIPEQYAEIVYHSFSGAKIKGVPVVVEPAKRKKA
jgi:predicted nucleic acid-binding Zn finger protein